MDYNSWEAGNSLKYEVLDLVEALMHASHDTKHDKANYFRLVYETLRGKLDQPDAQFRALLLPLLGDKDYEKVLDVVAKTEKRTARANNRSLPQDSEPRRWSPYRVNQSSSVFLLWTIGSFSSELQVGKTGSTLSRKGTFVYSIGSTTN